MLEKWSVMCGSGLAAGDAFDEDVHDAAADLVLAVQRLGEVHGDDGRLAGLDHLHRLLPYFVLATAAADRAEEGAVRPHDHLGAGLARRGAARARHGCHHQRLALLERARDLDIDFVTHACPPFAVISRLMTFYHGRTVRHVALDEQTCSWHCENKTDHLS